MFPLGERHRSLAVVLQRVVFAAEHPVAAVCAQYELRRLPLHGLDRPLLVSHPRGPKIDLAQRQAGIVLVLIVLELMALELEVPPLECVVILPTLLQPGAFPQAVLQERRTPILAAADTITIIVGVEASQRIQEPIVLIVILRLAWFPTNKMRLLKLKKLFFE